MMITEKEIDESMDISSCSLGTYEMLLICFGFLGIHRMYAKKYITGCVVLVLGIISSLSGFFTIPYVTVIASLVSYGFYLFDLYAATWGFVYDGKGKEIIETKKRDSLAGLVITALILIVLILIYAFFDLLYIIQLIVYSVMFIIYLIRNIKEIIA